MIALFLDPAFNFFTFYPINRTIARLDSIRDFHEKKSFDQQVRTEAQLRCRNTSSTLFNFQRIIKQAISDFNKNNVVIQWVKKDGSFFFGGISQPPNNEPSYTYVGSVKNFIQNETLFDIKTKREIITQYVSSSHATLSHVMNIPIDICSFKHVFKNPNLNAFLVLERICYNNIFSVNNSNELSDFEKLVLLFLFGISSSAIDRIIEQAHLRSRSLHREKVETDIIRRPKKRRQQRSRSLSCGDANFVCVDLNFSSNDELTFRRIEFTEDLLLDILTTQTFRYNEDELLTMASILSDKLSSQKREFQLVLNTCSYAQIFLMHVLKCNFLNDYNDPRHVHSLLSCNESVYEHVCHGIFVGHSKIPLVKSVDFLVSNSCDFSLKTKVFFCRRILSHPDVVKLSTDELRQLKVKLQRVCKYAIQFDYHLCSNAWLEPDTFFSLTQNFFLSAFSLDFLLYLYLKRRKFILLINLRDLSRNFGFEKIYDFMSNRSYGFYKKIVLFFDDIADFVTLFDLSTKRDFLRSLILETEFIDEVTRILLLDCYNKFFGRERDYDLFWLESLVRRTLGLTLDPAKPGSLLTEISTRYLLPQHFVRGF